LEAVGANAPQIEYWNGPAGDRWAELADSQDILLGALGLAAIDACDIQPGHTVLDIGCGSGTTTIETARLVGTEGHVFGIDISTPMLEIGRARLQSIENLGVTFDNKDVATYPFEEETFDRVFSRFGVMFFVDPIAAYSSTSPRRRLLIPKRLVRWLSPIPIEYDESCPKQGLLKLR
jgi:SAM-dependent methyltransferase